MGEKMQSVNNTCKLSLCLIVLIAVTGCSTVKVPIEVVHPAEINMKAYDQIAISDINGNLGDSFADNLKQKLVESERFKVIDRTRMREILKELKMSQSDLTDPRKRAKLGKLMSASALITGSAKGNYREGTFQKNTKCFDLLTQSLYDCIKYTREGIYTTAGGIDIIDVQTGELLRSKALNAKRKETNTAKNGIPEMIDKDALIAVAMNENVDMIVRAITPWKQTINAPFTKVKKIPELERGINRARLGKIDEALEIFEAACKKAEMNTELKPKEISEALWDLGLALEYTEQFDKARDVFEKGYEYYPDKPLIDITNIESPSFSPESKFILEIKHVAELKSEKSKLDMQL